MEGARPKTVFKDEEMKFCHQDDKTNVMVRVFLHNVKTLIHIVPSHTGCADSALTGSSYPGLREEDQAQTVKILNLRSDVRRLEQDQAAICSSDCSPSTGPVFTCRPRPSLC